MKLFEIENVTTVAKNNIFFDKMSEDWNEVKEDAKIIGKLNTFNILCSIENNEIFYALYDTIKKSYVLFSVLKRFGKYKNSYNTHLLSIKPEYSSLNIPVKFYSWLIKKQDLILVSCDKQSIGGRSVWEKLANYPGIHIFGYNQKTKELFEIDSSELFNENIYTQEIDDEIEQLNKEELDVRNSRNQYSKIEEYKLRKYFILKKQELEKLRLEISVNIVLIAQKEN